MTQSQKLAHRAFTAIAKRFEINTTQPSPVVTACLSNRKKYLSFARSFATLIHTNGLAQATAFALAKKHEQGMVLDDLAQVLERESGANLQKESRGENMANTPAPGLLDYLHLSRDALAAATWLKRYAEALLDNEVPATAERTS